MCSVLQASYQHKTTDEAEFQKHTKNNILIGKIKADRSCLSSDDASSQSHAALLLQSLSICLHTACVLSFTNTQFTAQTTSI